MLIEPGALVKGKYRVDRVLGEGGMGIVVAARHIDLDQRVAIKFLLPAMLKHDDIVERFAREARAASKIESDHVARVLDVDRLEDGTPFMVMEYLEGRDLSGVRKDKRPLPMPYAVGYLLEACDAIREAHRLGIVHRDIKPANIFLARRADGKTRVKVLDFGISKMSGGPGEPSMTKTMTVMGSAEYMSPEQMLATREVDLRTDIWALGVTLYELVTAQVPFPGQSITQVCALVMSQQAAPPSTIRPELPPAFDAVVLRCLEKDRDRRFSSVDELAAALLPFSPGGAAAGDRPSFEPRSAPSSTALLAQPAPSSPGTRPTQGGGYAEPRTAVLDKSTPPAPVSGTSERQGSTTAAVSSVKPTVPGVSSNAPIFIALGLGALMLASVTAVGIWFAVREPAAASSSESTSSASVAATAMVTATAETPQEAPAANVAVTAPVVSPAASESASPSASASATETPTKHPSHSTPASSPTHTPHTPSPAPAKVNCNPPFTVDAQGVKHAKPECL